VLAKLFALFTIVPLIELLLLIPLSQVMGTIPTIVLVVTTALVGAVLGKSQGLQAWRRINEEFASGKLPGDAILDGLIVLVACVFLITPGVLTDVFGISMLIPFMRAPVRRFLKSRWTKRLQNGSVTYIDLTAGQAPTRSYDSDVIDVTPPHAEPEQDAPPSREEKAVPIQLDG
jgi:UPF0716 protein FxsA